MKIVVGWLDGLMKMDGARYTIFSFLYFGTVSPDILYIAHVVTFNPNVTIDYAQRWSLS